MKTMKTVVSMAMACAMAATASMAMADPTGQQKSVPPESVQADRQTRPPPSPPMTCHEVCAGTDARGICTSYKTVCG